MSFGKSSNQCSEPTLPHARLEPEAKGKIINTKPVFSQNFEILFIVNFFTLLLIFISLDYWFFGGESSLILHPRQMPHLLHLVLALL